MRSVIFDIDGTLSDPSHRLHHIKGGNRNWPAFFDAMGDDPVHEPIQWLNELMDGQVQVLITTGRPETHREHTEAWLDQHGIRYHTLYMRAADDHRPDYIVKEQILDAIIADGFEVLLVIDDRQSVVDMWRKRGLTCLQCRKDDGVSDFTKFGTLTLMVGPSGAGKTAWLEQHDTPLTDFGIHPDHIVSSDKIRRDICGDFRDQTRNEDVFAALHAVVRSRISSGLPTVVDATNLKRKDRLAIVNLSRPDADVRYIVIDRHMERKRATAGWRAELPIDLLAKHDQVFRSNLKDILAGDGLPNVRVYDLRDLT